MKRFCIVLSLLLALLVTIVIGFITFFDHSDWLNAQIKQSTGYDIRYQQFEGSWITEKRISLIGVSLYQQDQRVMLIKKIDIDVDKLDLWQRLLEIKSINVTGVEIDRPLLEHTTTVKTAGVKNNITLHAGTDSQKLAWQRVHIRHLIISGLNGEVAYQGQHLKLADAQLALHDLLIIDHQQLQPFPANVDIEFGAKHLQVSAGQQQLQIDDLQLSAQAGLLQRQAKLDITSGQITLDFPAQQTLAFDALRLGFAFDKDRLLLDHFSLDAFSGSIAIQADARVALKLFPTPMLKVQQVTLTSLIASDMTIYIPAWLIEAEQAHAPNEQQQTVLPIETLPIETLPIEKMPIETLLIKQLKLDNINISSVNDRFPLQLKNLQLQLNNLNVIEHQQWIKFPLDHAQTGHFSLAFDHFNWQQTVIQQLSIVGSLSDDDPSLLFFNQLLFDLGSKHK